jgi:very-short-patch-repair endonuclease
MALVRRKISPQASRLRRDATDVEQKLWSALRNRQLNGLKFRRQATIGPYIVDFLCAEYKLVIELDGGQHNETSDAARTTYLETQSYRVLRFWNHEMIESFDGVLAKILATVEEKKTLTQPSPASGRGL